MEIQIHRKKPFLLAFASFLILLHNLGKIWGLGMSRALFAWGATPGNDRSFEKSEKPPTTPSLDAYERADPPAPGARPNPAASVTGPGSGLLHRRPWAREAARQFPSRGLNDKAKTLEKAVAAYPTSSASGSGHSSSSAKATPGNEGDSKNRQAPGKVGEPQNLMGMNGNSENRHPKAPNSMGTGNGQQNSGCFLFL